MSVAHFHALEPHVSSAPRQRADVCWEGHHIAHQVENEILAALPQISEVLVHIEPEEELTIKQTVGS